ncbi:MAG TPA: hypothetical protein VG816_03685 [Solirubrobacterales bacterium]|nr:hypothetical protein [Solirubrobacterales bacterium]
MTRTKLGLLGLCVVVLGLTAFSAGAQATTGAKWLILNGKGEIKEGAVLHASLGAEAESVHILHTEILKVKVLFSCTAVKLINAKLLANGSVGEAEGAVRGSKILYSGCTTTLNGVSSPECTPKDAADGAGTIVSKAGHGLAFLGTAGEDLVKVLPDEGEVFAVFEFAATCSLGTKIPVIGKMVFKDCENLALTHLVKHLSEVGPGAELWVISKTEEHKTIILGSTWLFLTGEHEGLKFSISNL